MENKFLQSCIGISIVIFAVGFLIRSVVPAKAEVQKSRIIFPEEPNSVGKYMMTYQMQEHYKDGPSDAGNLYHVVWRQVLVWDTETGKSKMYYKDNNGHFQASTHQLPSQPLGDTTGKYMMSFQMEDHYQDGPSDAGNLYHDVWQQILVWDTETGKSKIYYYDGGWQPVTNQLPQDPLK